MPPTVLSGCLGMLYPINPKPLTLTATHTGQTSRAP
jgi:hypothetical protein